MSKEEKNGRFYKIAGVVISVCILLITLAGIIYAMGGQGKTVKYNKKELERICPKVEEHETKISVLENDITYIKEGVDRIEKKL